VTKSEKLRAYALERSRQAMLDVSPHASDAVRQLGEIAARQGKTQMEIEEESGIGRSSMSRWLGGKHSPLLNAFESAAQLLGYRIVLVPIEGASHD
jgi:hypothetical protein